MSDTAEYPTIKAPEPPAEPEGDAPVTCELCRADEVNDPLVDWCVSCDRKVCDDCIDNTDEESGMRLCVDCARPIPPTP